MEFRGLSWRMADSFWRQIEPLLPKYAASSRGGRPRADLRQVMNGIFYVLRTGCQWKALPREFGSGSTVHRYFQQWTEGGVFGKAWRQMLKRYDRRRRIGAVTTITEVSSGLPFPARVDTGATTCSIHYEALEIEDESESPEDNVGKRIRILIQNRDGDQEWVRTKIVDYVTVRTTTDDDERYEVRLKLRWQDVEKKVRVTLNDRAKMKYPLLVGRNFLRGDFLVDVNLDGEK